MRKLLNFCRGGVLASLFIIAMLAHIGCSNSSDPLPYSGSTPTPATVVDLSTITTDFVVQDNSIVTGTLAANVKITIAPGAKVTLKNAVINGTDDASYKWAGLTCAGDATITLEGTNTLKGFWKYYPGLFVPKGKTLTIKGSGSLAANSNGYGAGIGGCYAVDSSSHIPKEEGSCGTIVIEGGTITATGGMSAGIGCSYGSDCDGVTIKGGTVTATGGTMAAGIGSGGGNSVCGPISISGGTVTAEGGQYSAGVGTGYLTDSKCGAITVANTVTKFTATKGTDATDSVGHGKNGGACGAVTIGGTVYWDGSAYQNEGATVLGQSPYTYQPSPAPGPTPGTTLDLSTVTADTTVADGYTITGTLGGCYKISIADGATVTLSGVSINPNRTIKGRDVPGLTCEGDATIVIADGSENTIIFMAVGGITQNPGGAGIFVPDGKTLTIEGNTGSLTAIGTGAGIGANPIEKGGNVVIKGGFITASGSGAGIGCGDRADCGYITISGGTVTASSASSSSNAGIGASTGQECGDILVTGGTVTASGRYTGPGIGAGGVRKDLSTQVNTPSKCGAITILNTVTKVTAARGPDSGAKYSVGMVEGSSCGKITIGGTTYWDGSAFQNGGDTVLNVSSYVYDPSQP